MSAMPKSRCEDQSKVKYAGWKREHYERCSQTPFVQPQLCYDYSPKYVLCPDLWIAQLKLDGHRALCMITDNGPRFFSRRVSVKTDWLAENTDCLPHLSSLHIPNAPVGTILDGELTHPKGYLNVQKVTNSLPARAEEFQENNGYLEYNVFDVVYFGGIQVLNPLTTRLDMVKRILEDKDCPKYLKPTITYNEGYEDNYDSVFFKVLEEGGEGLVLKKLTSMYEIGKRSKFWLKRKAVRTFDVVITGFAEPEEEYGGKYPNAWPYSINGVKVTRTKYLGYIGAIEFGIYKDGKIIKIGEAKGFTDGQQEFIKRNKEKLLGTVIEVKAQQVINQETKSLRHTNFLRFRPEKNPYECTWETVN